MHIRTVAAQACAALACSLVVTACSATQHDGAVTTGTATPPGDGDAAVTTSAGLVDLRTDLPPGLSWSWEDAWPEDLVEVPSPGTQRGATLDDGCQLSHYVAQVSDLPLATAQATSDDELTQLAAEGTQAGRVGVPARITRARTSGAGAGVEGVELLLAAPASVEDDSGATWTTTRLVRASRTGDVLLGVQLTCPAGAGLDSPAQTDLLLERAARVRLVAHPR